VVITGLTGVKVKKDTAVQALPPNRVSFEVMCNGFLIPCHQSSP